MTNEIPTVANFLAIFKRLTPVEGIEDYKVEFRQRYNDGLPVVVAPFWIEAQRERSERNGLYDVCCQTRKEQRVVLFGDIQGQFDALRIMITAREAWEQVRPVERVYFIGTKLERGRLIKVGYSRNPESRLATLQTAHGEPLQIFATVEGGKSLEDRYHHRWYARRREGEWFTIGDCVIKEIERLNKIKVG